MRHPLDCFVNPRSVAVVGASTVPNKTGGRRWRSMVDAGFPGPLYPIHPSAPEVLGRKAYRSLRDVPGAVDLAIVLVRPDLVPGVIAECAELRVRGVVVITAGFGETGPEGKALERDLVERLRAGGGRMIGPNCAGLFSASGRVNALGWQPPAGPVAVISQSGNMALTFAQFARQKGLGFSKLITVGNAADIRIPEYVDYLFSDPETKVIVAYLEGFEASEGRELFTLLRTHPTPKPLIVLKPGETESGRRAALSHTGALAGRHRIVEAALRQAGALQVRDSEEAWDAAMALALLPPLDSGSVVVISDGGGHAAIVCDAADRSGLAVPRLSAPTMDALAKILPARSAIINPVDFAGLAEEEPEVIPQVLEVCLADHGIGGAILAGHFGGYFKITTEALGQRELEAARQMVEVVKRHGKPMILHTIYGDEPLPALEELRHAGIPVYKSLEASARAMGSLWRLREARPLPKAEPPLRVDAGRIAAVLGRATGPNRRLLLEPDARELLTLYGIPVPPFRVATTPDEAVAAARDLGGPLALKLVSADIVHKTELGAVLLDVKGPEAAAIGHGELVRRARTATSGAVRVLVTPMIHGGIETVVGAFRDSQFGPVVMFGLGGILVEALDDVVFRLAPIDPAEGEAMVGELRSHRLFRGLRGRPPADLAALGQVIAQVSRLVADRPEVVELDLNPVFALEHGAAVADARVLLA
ncbi:MAG TPA: acetate--CoA ligase family protein [Methylomirabilota bacterium]|nr:acetate--CoA ligase family protein [Methylomirabilota bacterium]